MLLLVFQGTALAVALRLSRTRDPHSTSKPYLASVSVAVTELIKLIMCCAVELRHCHLAAAEIGEPLSKAAGRRAKELARSSLPMLLPAGMFVMQQVRWDAVAAGRGGGWGSQPSTARRGQQMGIWTVDARCSQAHQER